MRLAGELEQSLNVSPTIRWGGPGQLDVLADGKIVFSKKAARRLPTPGEVVGLMRRLAP